MELVVEQGADRGQRFSIAQSRFTIGRGAQCEVVLHDELVSHCHAELWWQDGAWIVQDHNSVNGTWVNRQRLQGPYRLRPGDQVGVGRTIISFAHLGPHLDHIEMPVGAPAASAASSGNGLAFAFDALAICSAVALIGSVGQTWFSYTFRVLFIQYTESIQGVDTMLGKTVRLGGLLVLLLAMAALVLRLLLRRETRASHALATFLQWIPWLHIGVGIAMLVAGAVHLMLYERGAQTELLLGLKIQDLVTLTPELGVFIAGIGLLLLLLSAGGQIAMMNLARQR